MREELRKRGLQLVKYIEKKTGVKINLCYRGSNEDSDGRTYCPANLIVIYDNQDNWEWLKEVIVHECAHRLDCKYRGYIHHKPEYEHDKNYWKCYDEIMGIIKTSSECSES
jgi:hypothetical protein